MSRQGLDMRYGRQGGRIVPFAADAHDVTATCSACGGTMINADAETHAECTPAPPAPAEPSLFDVEGGA